MHELAKVEVAEHLLQEVPHHFVDYMVLKTITEDRRRTPTEVGAQNHSDLESRETEREMLDNNAEVRQTEENMMMT